MRATEFRTCTKHGDEGPLFGGSSMSVPGEERTRPVLDPCTHVLPRLLTLVLNNSPNRWALMSANLLQKAARGSAHAAPGEVDPRFV